MFRIRFWIEDTQRWGDEVEVDILQEKFQINDNFDEALSMASFRSYRSDLRTYALPIEAWTKCRVERDDGVVKDYFVESYDDEVVTFENKSDNTFRFGNEFGVSIKLVELLKVTQHIYPDNLCFSNNMDASGNIVTRTMGQLVNRLCTQLWSMPDSVRAEGVPFLMVYDYEAEWTQRTAPEMFFTGLNLFEILVQIGQAIGGFPELSFDDNSNTYSLSWRIWDDPNKPHYEDADLIALSSHSGIDGHANVIVADLKNLQNMSLDGENTVIEPGYSEFMPVCTEDYSVDIANGAGFFEVAMPIAKINRITIGVNNGQSISTISFGNTSRDDYALNALIKEYTEWRTLPSMTIAGLLEDNAPLGTTKNTTLYYNKGDTRINNLGEADGSGGAPYFTNTVANWLKTYYYIMYNGANIANSSRFYIRIEYVPFQNVRVKMCKGDNEMPIMELQNQTSNVISSSAIADNLQGLVKRMRGTYTVFQKQVPRDALIYNSGDWLNGEIIVNAQHEIDNLYITSIYTTAPFNRRSEYINVYNNIRLWAIPEDKVADRDIHYGENVFVEINGEVPVHDGSLTAAGQSLLTDYASEQKPPTLAYVAWKTASEVASDVDTDSTDYALATVSSLPLGKSIVMTWRALDNAAMGNRRFAKNEVTQYAATLQNFVPYNPNAPYMCVKMSNVAPLSYDFDNIKLPYAGENFNENFQFSFPASNKKQYVDCASLAEFGEWQIAKDIRERIGFNFQLDFFGKNGTIVYNRAVTLNRLCSLTPTNELKVYKNSTTPYGDYEQIVHADAIEVVNTGFTADGNGINIACNVGSYNNLVITDADGNLLFATNRAGSASQTLSVVMENRKKVWKRI